MSISQPLTPGPTSLRSPQVAQTRLAILQDRQDNRRKDRAREAGEYERLSQYLAIADTVHDALDKLSEDMFGQIVRVLEDKLTLALQEVLEQPILLKADCSYKGGSASISFYTERNGHREDIMRGQGGSVVNILSVGLRMFALATLDPSQHRRFLVLDEQDCWLRPDLVPRLVKIVHEASRALGFQVLMISHHDLPAFEQYADKVYEFQPDANGLRVTERCKTATTTDCQ
ncbi:MAG: DNA repair protein [Pirellulaceae bacterium]|nr:DNA repair protein [Pirellulaceae bacterium]